MRTRERPVEFDCRVIYALAKVNDRENQVKHARSAIPESRHMAQIANRASTGHFRTSSAAIAIAAAVAASTVLSACSTTQIMTHGAVITRDQIDLVPVGSSKDQVLLALGTPSTTGAFDGEVYYYISQKKQKNFAFQKGKIVEQRVIAVYFDETQIVTRVADYGLQDGKVFDFISRTTPTTGRDLTFLGQILSGPTAGGKNAPINPLPTAGTGGMPGGGGGFPQ
jgi:outer membrane protein assembly factor BamE (lipoprotein component of BamABCDE complex)